MTDSSAPLPDSSPAALPAPRKRHLARNILLIVVGVLLLIFVGIQLIPVNRTDPPVTSQLNWDSPQTAALATRACMDCHSNETKWPWYSYVAPASWLVYYDTVRGRNQLNFSKLNTTSGGRQENPFSQPGDLAYRLGAILAGGGERGGRDRGPEGQFPRRTPGQEPPNGQFPTSVPGQQPPAGGFSGADGFSSEGSFGGFGGGLANRLNEAINNGQMPPKNYTLLHPSANLTAAERQQLLKGLLATFGLSTQ